MRDKAGAPDEKLEAVLQAYALICYYREQHGTKDLAALLHRGEHVTQAQQQILDLIRDMIAEVAQTGDLRNDAAPDELASYCLHALTAASTLRDEAAVRRLVTVTLAGLHPPLTRVCLMDISSMRIEASRKAIRSWSILTKYRSSTACKIISI
jgi:hypothetical protein